MPCTYAEMCCKKLVYYQPGERLPPAFMSRYQLQDVPSLVTVPCFQLSPFLLTLYILPESSHKLSYFCFVVVCLFFFNGAVYTCSKITEA